MARNAYADLTLADAQGGDLSLVFIAGGGARLYVGGDQPMDQPPCSVKLSRDQLARLADRIYRGLVASSGEGGR
jgi:hypothetical protein